MHVCLYFLFCNQHDVTTALFLLPHVLLFSLLDGTEEDTEEVRLMRQSTSSFFMYGCIFLRVVQYFGESAGQDTKDE